MTGFSDLHKQLGCSVRAVPGSADFVVDSSILVRVVSVWHALWALVTNKPFKCVMLVRRAKHRKRIVEMMLGDDGMIRDRLVGRARYLDEGNPDVVMDYETYCRMVAGLARQKLHDIEADGGEG